MATLADQDILDLTKSTLEDLGRMRFTQIATTLQYHECWGRALRQDRVEMKGGTGIQWRIMTRHNGAARQTTLFSNDNTTVQDTLETISVPWRHTETHWSWDRRELLMNTNGEEIVDLIKVRRADGTISLAEHLEDQFWSVPATSSDKLDIYGLPYWVSKYDSGIGTTPGHTGTQPNSNFTTIAGLDPDTTTRWRNYAGKYTDVSRSDALSKLKTGFRKMNFRSPIDIEDFRKGNGARFRLYVNDAVMTKLEEMAEGQNDQLGKDLDSMGQQLKDIDGLITYKRFPIVYIPKLDDDSDDPIYMIDHSVLYPVCLKGDYLRESDPKFKVGSQHNVVEVFIDLTWNLVCADRRCQGVLSTGTDN